MRTRYLRDHPVRPLQEWTGKQSLDWLHPSHGPLPNRIGSILCDADEYTVCLWLLPEHIVTMTELVDVSDVNDGWGNRENKTGWIVNSLLWKPTDDGFQCRNQHVTVPAALRVREDHEQEEKLLKEIMIKSVEITAGMTLGSPIENLRFSMKGSVCRKPQSTKILKPV